MKNKVLILTVIVALPLISSVFVSLAFTGLAVDEGNEFDYDYSYTTALCGGENGNECRDFHVVCLDGEAIRMDPISGLVVFPDDWEDRRAKDNKEFCG